MPCFLTLVNMFKKTAEDSPMRAEIWELVEVIRSIQANTKAEKTMELDPGHERQSHHFHRIPRNARIFAAIFPGAQY